MALLSESNIDINNKAVRKLETNRFSRPVECVFRELQKDIGISINYFPVSLLTFITLYLFNDFISEFEQIFVY